MLRLISLAFLVTALAYSSAVYAAPVILNEYNAVDDDACLEDPILPCGADPFWGARDGNGGDWFELVVIQDHLDMRQWQFIIVNDALGATQESFLLSLTLDPIWHDLRAGTIITISEDLRTNVDDYNPVVGHWWINARAAPETNGTYVTVQCLAPACAEQDANWKVSNKNWQMTIKNNLGAVVFGPAGEGITPLSGVGSDEVCKLEDDPGSDITPLSNFNDGGSSTFGAPNMWDGGTSVQDFSALRSPVTAYTPLTTVRINEVLSHSDPGFDWLELHNTTGTPINIGKWYISDSFDSLMDFQIPDDTIITEYGYVVFHQGSGPGELPFGFSSSQGDEVVLSAADSAGNLSGERDFIQFGPADNGITFGRVIDGGDHVYRMSYDTQGGPNAPPLVGPVVINEIMYHPMDPGLGATIDPEYIELHNITGAPVVLSEDFGALGIHPWSVGGGVQFEFSPDSTIPAHGFLLVVGFDPADSSALAEFRDTYSLHSSVEIVGPYSGGLNNFSDTVRLLKPDTPEGTLTPMVLIDDVTYFDFGDWPSAADGTGPSLERIDPEQVGRSPSNWAARTPFGTPGRANFTPIPAASTWGLVVMAIGFVTAASLLWPRRQ
jgi:hypothetical protein